MTLKVPTAAYSACVSRGASNVSAVGCDGVWTSSWVVRAGRGVGGGRSAAQNRGPAAVPAHRARTHRDLLKDGAGPPSPSLLHTSLPPSPPLFFLASLCKSRAPSSLRRAKGPIDPGPWPTRCGGFFFGRLWRASQCHPRRRRLGLLKVRQMRRSAAPALGAEVAAECKRPGGVPGPG